GWRGTARDGPDRDAWLRALLTIGLWILLPSYCFFYCRSVPDFVSPSEIIEWAQAVDYRWAWGGAILFWAAAAWWFSGGSVKERFRKTGEFLAVCAFLFLLCSAASAMWRHLHDESLRRYPDLQWRSIFQVRYMGVILPAVWLAA